MKLIFFLLRLYTILKSDLKLRGKLIYPTDKCLSFLICVMENRGVKYYNYRFTVFLPRSDKILFQNSGTLECQDSILDFDEDQINENWKWTIIAECASYEPSGHDVDIPWIFEYKVCPIKRFSLSFLINDKIRIWTVFKYFIVNLKKKTIVI